MTTAQEFNCVFCKETFSSKEELQIHFRKHGDPKFNSSSKTRSKSQNESSDEKRNEEAEMVSCDVCTEVFPTISKAITHKHKVHPDHDAKYFCPWCGKLFTMKHLYNKHLQSNHKEMERSDNINFHCDMCNVDFYVASAMLYHNKFFHRQDTDIPIIGQSKKIRMINQDILQIYYCAFCGDEYDNKVNLHKHMLDDHGDENQSPEDVLRCPLCEAVFYHLDAYELHLTFHSTDDLYKETNELFEQITEFSLETVPPSMEKVEDMEPQDVETAMNAIGLDKFLEMAMDTSVDKDNDHENPKKSKKHKKHKKSKKAAITLDEFLNMNKDVFGEGLDFQGIEEVPTKIVAKRLKQKKGERSNVKLLKSADLAKLKKQGIVVKMKSNKQPVKTVKIPSKTSLAPQQPVPSKVISQTKTPDEVLSKLLNQGNSQIKIVKKTLKDDADTDSCDKMISPTGIDNLEKATPGNMAEQCDVAPDRSSSTNDESEAQEQVTNLEGNNKNATSTSAISDSPLAKVHDNVQSQNEIISHNNEQSNPKDSCEKDNDDNPEINIVKIKPNVTNNNDSIKSSNSENNNTDNINQLKAKGDILSGKGKVSPPPVSNKPTKNSSLDALKHLSHLITIKSVNAKGDSSENSKMPHYSETSDAEMSEPEDYDDKSEDEFIKSPIEKEPLPTSSNDNKDIPKSLETLKSLNKNITIKPSSHSPKTDKIKNTSTFKNVSTSAVEQNSPIKTLTTVNTVDIKTTQSPKLKQIDEKKDQMSISDKLEKQNMNVNLLKNLTNITAKPVNKINKVISDNSKTSPQVIEKKNVSQSEIKKNEINKDIEIFNIDDSDSDEAEKYTTAVQELNTRKIVSNEQISNKSLEKLRNVQNITVKTHNQQKSIVNKSIVQQIPNFKETLRISNQCSMSDFSDEDDQDMLMPANLSINQKLTLQSSNIQALKNLGKNITVKSRNSSPSVSTKSNMDLNFSQNSVDNMDDADSDNDSVPGKVKISEINEDNFSEDDIGDDKVNDREYEANVSVQSPEASNSDQDCDLHDDPDELDDLESQIKKSTLKKPLKMASNQTLGLQSFNKDITIKSISKDNKVQPSPSKVIPNVPKNNKELSIKPYKQTKTDMGNDLSKSNNVAKAVKATNQSVNMASNSQLSTVNKEVTVKTFQTKTVIQEITTTVTKTIKTVNQTVKQQQQQISSQTGQPMKYQRVQGMKSNQNVKNIQGITVRQAAPAAGTRVRGLTPTRPCVGMNVRPANQLVPVRPSFNPIRAGTPRMPVVRKVATPSNQSSPIVGRPVKISPNVVTTSKRASEEAVGHFSCFKKPKESLIPVSDIPNFENEQMSSTVHYASSQSRTNFSSATKTVKGNTVVTSTQMKSETSNSSQHLSKLNNISGLKIVKTSQNKQTMQVEEKSELSASQRNTIEAIEKLQKQGLLLKKPRMDVNNYSDPSDEENDQYTTEEPED